MGVLPFLVLFYLRGRGRGEKLFVRMHVRLLNPFGQKTQLTFESFLQVVGCKEINWNLLLIEQVIDKYNILLSLCLSVCLSVCLSRCLSETSFLLAGFLWFFWVLSCHSLSQAWPPIQFHISQCYSLCNPVSVTVTASLWISFFGCVFLEHVYSGELFLW